MGKDASKTTREIVFEIAAAYIGVDVNQLSGQTKLGEAGCDCVSVISERFGGVQIVAGVDTSLDEIIQQIERQNIEVG